MRTHESIGIGIPEILLPEQGIDRRKWAVIACDQFTSEPEYWQKVSQTVGDAPSTLNLIYPEVYLGEKKPDARIARIRKSMRKYLDEGIFEELEGFVYVERKVGEKTRKGLVVCLDLENYDFHKGSSSLIRATEGTILDRLPPRIKIREGAFENFEGVVDSIDEERGIVKVIVSIFGRSTPLDIEYWQIEKI